MIKDSNDRFTNTTIILHWVIGIAIIMLLISGTIMHEMDRSALKFEIMGVHKSIGFIVFILAVIRIIWRFVNGLPSDIAEMPNWQKLASQSVHILLLIGTLLMPISGVMMTTGSGQPVKVFGFQVIPGDKLPKPVSQSMFEQKNMAKVILVHDYGNDDEDHEVMDGADKGSEVSEKKKSRPRTLKAEIGATIHGIGSKIMIIALILHVLGAFKHHYFERNNVLNRMLGKKFK